MEKNIRISQVLEKSYSSASDMTHTLSSLGNGEMGVGVRRLWMNGLETGLEAGLETGLKVGRIEMLVVMSIVASIGIGIKGLYKYHQKKLDDNEPDVKEVRPNIDVDSANLI